MKPRVGSGRPAGAWASFLVLLLFATLGVHVWPELVPWRAQTLHRDLPYLGVAFAALGLIGAFPPLRGRIRALGPIGLSPRWLVAIAGLLGALVALPAVLVGSRAGLTIQTGSAWGAPGAAAAPRPVPRLDLGPGSGGAWAGDGFYAVLSGWLYAPVDGTYHIALDADADAMVELDGQAVVGRGVPGGQQPPGVTDAVTGFRRTRVDLGAGFHAIRIASRHETGSARLRVRWILPWLSHAITIPTDHLLPADAPAREMSLGRLALAGRRVGVAGLTCLGLGAVALGVAFAKRRAGTPPPHADRVAHAGLGLLFFVLTGTPLLLWAEQAPVVAPLLLAACALGLIVMGTLAFVHARRPSRRTAFRWPARIGDLYRVVPVVALLLVQVVLTARFLAFVDGRLPMPGDHSSFLYRYYALLHALPRPRFYDPWWNAGSVDPSFVLSGATAVLALTWPLLLVWRLTAVYPAFIPIVGAILAPWSLYAATRLLGGSRLAALLAGLLALAPGDFYFWWLMAHGTLPSIVSAALAPLVVALGWRVFGLRDQRWLLVVALTAVLILGLYWVGFALMIVPTILIGAVTCRRRLRRRDMWLALGVAAGVLLVHAHWLVGFRWFPNLPFLGPYGGTPFTWRSYLEDLLLPMVFDPNPIALALGGVGILLLPGVLRRVYGGFVLSLFLVATVVHPMARHLELDRFLVPLGIALVPPAAWLGARLLRAAVRGGFRTLSLLVGFGLIAVLVVHLDGVWRQYSGQVRRTARQVEFLAPPTQELVDWIRASAETDARTLIWGDLPGPSRLEGGYKAFLQPLTGRPLMGYHVNPKAVDMNLKRLFEAPDVLAALEAFNVRHVIVNDEQTSTQAQLERTPGVRFRGALSKFRVYDVDIRPTYLRGARGTVAFDYDRLDVRLDETVEAVTLKFRWAPGLVSDPPLPLEPVEILPDVRLIRVRTGDVRAFRIRYTDCCVWHPAELWARWRDRRS